MRDYCCRGSLRKQKAKDHWTGRYCTVKGCDGKLHDTIINFGETLHEIPLKRANKESDKCDVMLCLGSSLTVYPAANCPKKVGHKASKWSIGNNKHHLVIVNLQKTPLHDLCTLPIFAKIDDVMIGLMKELELDIPKWYLPRYMKLSMKSLKNNNYKKLTVYGVDRDGTKFTLFKDVKLRNNDGKLQGNKSNDQFVFLIPTKDLMQDANKIEMKLSFFYNYKEPALTVCLNEYLMDSILHRDGEIVLKMTFDPENRTWTKPIQYEQEMEKQLKENEDEKSNDESTTVKYIVLGSALMIGLLAKWCLS